MHVVKFAVLFASRVSLTDSCMLTDFANPANAAGRTMTWHEACEAIHLPACSFFELYPLVRVSSVVVILFERTSALWIEFLIFSCNERGRMQPLKLDLRGLSSWSLSIQRNVATF